MSRDELAEFLADFWDGRYQRRKGWEHRTDLALADALLAAFDLKPR